jgi:hypothetical protein
MKKAAEKGIYDALNMYNLCVVVVVVVATAATILLPIS